MEKEEIKETIKEKEKELEKAIDSSLELSHTPLPKDDEILTEVFVQSFNKLNEKIDILQKEIKELKQQEKKFKGW
jgi:hypothetical protein